MKALRKLWGRLWGRLPWARRLREQSALLAMQEAEAREAGRSAARRDQIRRGQWWNAYICAECRAAMVTVDRAEGLTPAVLRCRMTRHCQGVAISLRYNQETVRQIGKQPEWEWYQPQVLAGLSPEQKRHVEAGGLFLRRIGRQPNRSVRRRAGRPQKKS